MTLPKRVIVGAVVCHFYIPRQMFAVYATNSVQRYVIKVLCFVWFMQSSINRMLEAFFSLLIFRFVPNL